MIVKRSISFQHDVTQLETLLKKSETDWNVMCMLAANAPR